MQRRDFLKTIGGLAASTALPASALKTAQEALAFAPSDMTYFIKDQMDSATYPMENIPRYNHVTMLHHLDHNTHRFFEGEFKRHLLDYYTSIQCYADCMEALKPCMDTVKACIRAFKSDYDTEAAKLMHVWETVPQHHLREEAEAAWDQAKKRFDKQYPVSHWDMTSWVKALPSLDRPPQDIRADFDRLVDDIPNWEQLWRERLRSVECAPYSQRERECIRNMLRELPRFIEHRLPKMIEEVKQEYALNKQREQAEKSHAERELERQWNTLRTHGNDIY